MKKKIMLVLYEGRSMLFSRTFLLAVFLNTLFIYLASEMMLDEFVDVMEGVQTSYILGMTAYITPIFTSLPSVMRCHEERASGAYRMKVVRSGKIKYVLKEVLRGMLSGMLVMAFSLIFFTVAMSVYAWVLQVPVRFQGINEFFGSEDDPTMYYHLMQAGHSGVVYLLNCLALVCYGMIWPCLGTIVSMFVDNLRFAVVSPFLLKRLLEYAPDSFSIVNPAWMRMSSSMVEMPAGGFPYAICYLLCIGILAVLVLYAGMQVVYQRQG